METARGSPLEMLKTQAFPQSPAFETTGLPVAGQTS